MTSPDNEKETLSAHHDEEAAKPSSSNGEERLDGIETDLAGLPKGYFFSSYFLGSVMAIGLGLWAAVASFVSPLPHQ